MRARSETALIMLAAGASRRFGSTDKLLANFNGRPLLAQSLAVYDTLPVSRKIAVIAPDSATQDICRAADFDIVVNQKADDGMGTSMAAGINAAQGVDHALIALGDMPHIRPTTPQMLLRAIDDAHSIIVPHYHGRAGHPVVFAATHFANLQKLDGDKGGRGIITACPNVLTFAVDDAGICRDIDTPQALEEALDE